MSQQINLCTPILLTQKRYFSANTMLQALAVFVVLGGGLCGYGVWSLNVASDGFQKTLATQSQELDGLRAAIKQGRDGADPLEAALAKELRNSEVQFQERQSLLEALQRGLFRPGWGHAARLRLVAQTIPAQVWLTELKANDTELELGGFTLEPAALNDWVSRLAASPLLVGQKLSAVKVENASGAVIETLRGSAASTLPAGSLAMPSRSKPVWSFNLVSMLSKPTTAAETKR